MPAAAEALRRRGPGVVVLTTGADGGVLVDADGVHAFPALPVAVVDTPAEAPVDEAPAAVPEDPAAVAPPVVDPAPVDPALAPPMVGTQLPPNVAPPYVAPIPTKKPGILTRIKEKLTPGPG